MRSTVSPQRAAHLTACLTVVLAVVAPSGCGRPAAGDTTTAGVIDSVIPRAEALRRFQEGLQRPDSLSGGTGSREDLVFRFVAALEARDTTALNALSMTVEEFAYLYYPTNPQSLPPYDVSPGLLWFLIEGNSRKGLALALEERGGAPLGYVDHSCEGEPSHEGENTVWGPCVIRRVQAPGDTVSERLFGPIIERGGRYKFVNLANKL